MGLKSLYSNLCTPAKVYVWLALASTLGIVLGNIANPYEFSIGAYKTQLSFHNAFLAALHVFYIVVWTWILNKLCGDGRGVGPYVSWLLVLVPLLLAAVLVGLFLYATIQNVKRKAMQKLSKKQ